jgi:hypothetical protein
VVGKVQDQLEQDYVLGKKVRARRKGGGTALVAVRMPSELHRRIYEYGAMVNMTTSDVLRLGAERLLSESAYGSNAKTLISAISIQTTTEIADLYQTKEWFHEGWVVPGVRIPALPAAIPRPESAAESVVN